MRTVRSLVGIPGEGPYLQLEVDMAGDEIAAVRCLCNGCSTSVAVCDRLCQLLKIVQIDKVKSLSVEELGPLLPPIPEGKGHVLAMAHECLQRLWHETKMAG